jgi:hypothetical protein
VPPRSVTTAPRPSRARRLAELALVVAATEALHLALAGPGADFGSAELAAGALLLAAWLLRHTWEALRPRQRVRTWNKPRGLDRLRPGR